MFVRSDNEEVGYIADGVSALDDQLFLIPMSLIDSFFQERQRVCVRNTSVKLTNFHCAYYGREQSFDVRNMSHPYYRSPELINDSHPSYPNDIWSLGCVMFEMYCGQSMHDIFGLKKVNVAIGNAKKNAAAFEFVDPF